ncbi:MAG TPA: bifunctional UDP-N-acetylmuramoyl-tripeptide:D-alanyl-D-alanine ligase/alanine racemase [Prevotellaceae bacterium]|nr:bifunctional UDP-N-acetylmuramoyl-tripeptide:D-alanyl-D-alanine ligase/alanine racemase [Prevotellaceae bacterium]
MYTISEIAALTGAHRLGDKDYQIDWLLTDSRSLCFPQSTLFFALRTERGDGHRFIDELYRRGVRNFVVDHRLEQELPDANLLLVPDTRKALQRLAERHRETFNIPIIGITGSNGKTTVKEWLYQMLMDDYTVTRSPRSYNSQIGVPLSVWGLWEQTQIGIFEAAISQPGEMEALEAIIQPTIGVFTCLGAPHQENFESMEQKCREKLRLFQDARTLIYPADDPTVSKCVEEMGFQGKLIPWPSTGKGALEDDKEICRTVCRYLGMSEGVIAQRIARLEPVAMRLEVKSGRNGCTLINDSYNSDLGSLDIALDFMSRRPEREGLSRVLVLSDIQQTGIPARTLYTHVSQMARQRGVGRIMAVGPALCSCKDCFAGWGDSCTFYASTRELLRDKLFQQLRHSIILVKGARSFHFEQITDRLEQKVHETILEVNLGAVVKNLNHYRSFMKPETRMVCMVKADAYGAGAVEVAKTLQDHRVDYLAVAVADEGVTLRQAGITSSIMVMNPEMSSFRTLFQHSLEPEVYSFRLLEALIAEAEREGVVGFPIHIKLDTGMRRMGFDPERDMDRLVQRLKRQNAVLPCSVFSHFVGSDSDEFDEFSRHQFALYKKGSDQLQAAFRHHIIRHICNSAGIEHFPEYHMDMVRLGLGLYGVDSRTNKTINHVGTLRTTILQIHDVPAGESVGYSRRTFLTRDSRIASIPIGYADGLDRHLGNRHGYCLVGGQKAQYVGNICMDVCMIDVTDIDCKEGDAVIIFGEALPAAVLANWLDTIPYEVMTSVSSRVKRVYYQE